jgi:hypothetical protein
MIIGYIIAKNKRKITSPLTPLHFNKIERGKYNTKNTKSA